MTNNDIRPNGAQALPAPIVQALRRLIRRARQLIVIRGLCAACAAGIGAFLAVMLIDAGFTLLARWPRWLMTVAAYGVWAGALFRFLIRPLARSFTLTGIARLIETQHPELHERLSSVVEILGSRDIPAIRGSDVLIGALTEEAVRDAARLRPKREISFRSAIPLAIAAGLVVALLAALWVARPRQTRFLLARAAAPFLNLPNVHAADLAVEPGDTQVASGSDLRISIRTANAAVTACRLRQLDRRGREIVTDMEAVPGTVSQTGRVFSVVLPKVVAGFRYRIHAGDAVTRYFTVRVVIPPVISHLDIRCRYPDYSGLGVTQARDGSGTIRALAGSEVTVSAGVNKPVASAAMRVMAAAATNTFEGVARQAGGGLVYDFSLTLPKRLNGRWTLALTDEIGLGNAPFEYAIQSIPDQPPVPTLASPRQRELRLNREARLPVAYAAEDDLGLTGLALVFTLDGGSNETLRSLPLPTQAVQGVKAMQGETTLALDDPLFDGVARVTFRLRAADNLPASLGGPQYGHSDAVTLILDERAVAWKEQVLTSQEERVQQGLRQAQQKLAAARDQARALQAPLAQQAALSPESVRKIDAMQDALAAADNSLRELAADVEKGFFAALATNLAALADQHVGKAENLAGQLRLVDRPEERTAIHSNITAEIEGSLGTVERAIQEHERARAAVRRAVELDRLAEKQAALAQTRQEQERVAATAASNAAASVAADVEAWQRAQDQVADQLGGLARQTPGTPEQVAVAASNLAVQTAREAAALARRQEELAAMTRQQAEQRQQQEGAWRELAGRQEQLAALARRDPLSAPRSAPMQQAAADLAAGELGPSLKTQGEVADRLREDAERLLEPAVAAGTPGKAEPVDPGRAAAESLQKAEDGLKAARQAAENAGQAAREAEKRAASDAALVKRAQGAKSPDLAREFSVQAESSRQDAEAARQWSQAAAQSADLAGRAADEARQAAEQAGRQKPEPVRREAAERAERAAEKVERHAEDARAAAHQAAAKSAGRGSPQDRAVQAEERAVEAARDAAQSAVKAGLAAEQTRQEAEQAVKRAEQAVVNGSAPPQAQAAGEKAAEARARARAAAEAASKAREESVSASQDARAAQQAADRALRGVSPMTAPENAEAAERAAEAARQAAIRAADQARLADEASGPSRSDRERAAQAAEQAARNAAQAEQAAAAAQKVVQATAKPVADARRLVELAWGTGQNDLAQSAGKKALKAREQATRAAALADAARKSADAARQAATKAAEAGKEAGSSSTDREARQAEEAARQAGVEADRAGDLARQAEAAAGPAPAAAAVAGDAREVARQAQSAAQIAQSAAQGAQQAAQKATAAAQGTEQQAAEAAQSARQAAQAAGQAMQQADMSRGKPDEADKRRRAEDAQQTAQLAGQHEAAAKRAAQQARQVEQQVQEASGLSARSAQAAQQAAQMAQQAAQRAGQAASAASPQAAARRAGMDAGRAALAAVEKTRDSTAAAARANALAERARELLAGLNVARLAGQQEGLRRETAGLLAGKEAAGGALRADLPERPLAALQGQQEALSREVEALAQAASVVHAQADQVLARTPAVPKAGQAVREMDQAAQSAGQAAREMEPFARQGERLDGAAASAAPATSRNAAQAAERIRQAQQGAAQSLQQAARTLESAIQAMVAPAAPAATASKPAAADGEALAAAYGHARQAAAGRSADEAARAAGELARAAGQAVAEAQALGANPRPATLETAAGGGGGRPEEAQASEDIPSFARRLGIRLQDWLRLHGELKEDVLQAAGSEGPEEYRPLIKRYFREVSSHGGEE